MAATRFDIVSDTHGHVSDELLVALRGADMIMHAGDCCSYADYQTLCNFAPVAMCLGNNDWGMDYGPQVERVTRVFKEGLRWQLCHYEERLDLMTCDIAICGHSHRPFVRWESSPGGAGRVLVVNPGSPTFPRTADGPTIARIMAEKGQVLSAEIIRLQRKERKRGGDDWSISRLFRRR